MKSFSLKELAVLLSAQLVGDPEHRIHGVETLDDASPEDLSFLANPRYVEAMKRSQAGAICVHSATILSGNGNYLLSFDPSATFQKAVEAFHPSSAGTGFRGIHPTAVIHESVQIGPDVTIGPHVSIDRGCTIATGTTIGSNVSIGYEVHIGTHCTIYSNCTIREKSQLGNRVILQPGAVIGSCGFGYIQDRLGRHIKLEQLGTVILEDDVEIGANTTIDRSRFKSTIIRRGSKIDNLCQIAHNVEVGEDTIMAAQGGIAGSAKLGKRGMFGGQVGILGHVKLKDDVKIASRGGVSKSLKAGIYRGSPALPIAEYNRQEVYVRKLEEYVERIKQLEQKLAASSI